MFTRSILIPSLVVCAIAAPILLSQPKQEAETVDSPDGFAVQATFSGSGNVSLPATQTMGRFNAPLQQSGSAFLGSAFLPTAPNGETAIQQASQFLGNAGAVPDYGTTQTLIYPGDANGPNLNALPLEFMPITNFEEIFRFDLSADWIMSRWKRVSTTPGDSGLHGLRVALVTGTNSWDLHGSLTYYLDVNQHPQRITFRGWAGDGKKLTDFLMQRYDFKSQPTDWAGFYLAQSRWKTTGGILMQYPTVIYRDNPVQQVAVVMEINNPQGRFVLSDEFQSMIVGSQTPR